MLLSWLNWPEIQSLGHNLSIKNFVLYRRYLNRVKVFAERKASRPRITTLALLTDFKSRLLFVRKTLKAFCFFNQELSWYFKDLFLSTETTLSLLNTVATQLWLEVTTGRQLLPSRQGEDTFGIAGCDWLGVNIKFS